jgi:hypothetical protein
MINDHCRPKTRRGHPCKAPVSKNGLCAIHAEPARAAELGRRSGKARRYELGEKTVVPVPAPETVEDVRKALGQVMSDLVAHRVDTRTASSMAYVANVLLKAIEVSALEERMGALIFLYIK